MHDEWPDHYATLGLHRACTQDEVKSAFRILSKAHHPDVNGASPESMARTQAINEAYRVLGDATRRAAYDREREQQTAQATPRTVPPVKQEVLLDIDDLFRGATLRIELRDPGHPDGYESYPLDVPPDTAPGTRFRIRRAPPFASGHIDVRVKLRPDRCFKARGSDLRYELRTTAGRAASGGTEYIRGPTGNRLAVTIPARTARGTVIRVAGEGLPKTRGGRGDLLVRVMYRPEVRIGRGEADAPASRPRRRLLS